jgi:phenylacetic acid degradation protein paaN
MNTNTTSQNNPSMDLLEQSLAHLHSRQFFSAFPESPKEYPEAFITDGEKCFHQKLNNAFDGLYDTGCKTYIGEEVSPYLQTGLGITYPSFDTPTLIQQAQSAAPEWRTMPVTKRAEILLDALENIKNHFGELAYATMHTTGQSFLMSFQASGPHALDRALEAISLGHFELTRFNRDVEWTKNMGKFDLKLKKEFFPIPKGIGLLIGCSTFPTWNTLPGLFANLITGNVCIAKPHPKAVYPMAICVAAMQKVFSNHGLPPTIVQLATDTVAHPITKELCENPHIQLIDYTGGNDFGHYVEQIPNKTVFTEKAGINSVILDSSHNLQKTAQNLAFSLCLYSGQMCTAPQNIFIAEKGIMTPEGLVSVEDFKQILAEAIHQLVLHPKAGPGTVAAIQNDQTLKRIQDAAHSFTEFACKGQPITNPEFENARTLTPYVAVVNSDQKDLYLKEYFGPFAIIVKTSDIDESIQLASESAASKGAITCLAFCTDDTLVTRIREMLNLSFTPVSFNLEGAAFVNQHAAFSDFHVTGGNPAGNASFTDPNFINRRFVWVGNRYMM